MKNLINLWIIGLVILTSCSTVEFEEPLPKDTKPLKSFPKHLLGKYIDSENKDTLIISKQGFDYGGKNNFFSLNGELLVNNTVLKKFGDYYVLSKKGKNDNSWGIIPFKAVDNKIQVYYLLLDIDTKDKVKAAEYKEEKLARLQAITEVKTITDSKNNVENYLINPTNEQLKKMLKEDMFIKIIEFRRID